MERAMNPDPELVNQLLEQASEARTLAYAPYSDYSVGAAVRSTSGNVFTGANVENASYGLTMCAERSAVFSAVSQGDRAFDLMVLVNENAGMPCGACRQVLSEFGSDLLVVIADASGKIHKQLTVAELIPNEFGPQDLIQP